jgi:hypothetical protein
MSRWDVAGAPFRPRANQSQVGQTALDAGAFIIPALSFVEVTILGRLIVVELVMAILLPLLWSARERLRMPPWFIVLWTGWLFGQIITDLVAQTAFEDLARGWAAIAFTMTNFAAILVLASTPRRARLFAMGLAVGGVVGFLTVPHIYASTDPWKWAFALPAGLFLAAGVSHRGASQRPWLALGAFGIFGLVSLYLGSRSLGGISLLTTGYLLLGAIVGRGATRGIRSPVRVIAGLAALAIAVVLTLQLYEAAASSGALGGDAQDRYFQQSGALGSLVGGRSEILATSQAILDSPLLGHGSWAKDFAYIDLLADRLSSLGYQVGAGVSDVGLIPAHSYLMGSWVWAGIAGALFWLAVAALAVWLLLNLFAARIDATPLLVFSAMMLLWNIAFSPYGFASRITAPYSIVLCLLGLRLVFTNDEAPEMPRTGARSASTSFTRDWTSRPIGSRDIVRRDAGPL